MTTLIGNNLAVLVAADELARLGQPVTLFTDGKPPGGHFGGMQVAGHDFDMGMVLLEQHAPAARGLPLHLFKPALRNDWTRFGDQGSAWLEAQLPLRRTPTPQALVEGRIVPDHLIANRLDGLAGTGLPAPVLPRSDERHAAHKGHAGAYDRLSYAEAAALNHGTELHARWIEPFARKVLGVPSDAYLARFHRTGWVPLYYPETLAAALQGEPTGLPEYPFWTTPQGFVGQVVRQLKTRLAAAPHAIVATEPVTALAWRNGAWQVQTAERRHQASRVVLGLAPERAAALLGLPAPAPAAAASVTLWFARVHAEAIRRELGCLMVVDEGYASYRVSDQDALAGLSPDRHRVVVEASPGALERRYPGEAPENALRRELMTLMQLERDDAIEPLKCILAKNALALPTHAGVSAAHATHEAMQAAAPQALLTGTLLGYGVASFNDQLVQGLKIAQELA